MIMQRPGVKGGYSKTRIRGRNWDSWSENEAMSNL